MAIQIAHQRGSRVLTTAGTPRKLAFCRELGADVAINYRETDFDDEVAAATGGAGVDVILDNMGRPTWPATCAPWRSADG